MDEVIGKHSAGGGEAQLRVGGDPLGEFGVVARRGGEELGE
jgi:hypothetical protein